MIDKKLCFKSVNVAVIRQCNWLFTELFWKKMKVSAGVNVPAAQCTEEMVTMLGSDNERMELMIQMNQGSMKLVNCIVVVQISS